MPYQDTIMIFCLILDIANQVADKNETYSMMYKTVFENPRFKGYWEVLVENGLLDFDPHTQTFKTTEKGLAFLRVYNNRDEGPTQ
jgi:predicted transcriptional regulator